MTRNALTVLFLAVAALGGAVAFGALRHRCGCCERGRAVEPQTPEGALAAALRARSSGDLGALLALCSDAGRRQVEADLAAFSTVLRDPATGPRSVARLAAKTDAERDDLRLAIDGDAAAAFRVLARAAPLSPPAPEDPAPAPAAASPDRVALEYVAPDGGRRLVSLARDGAAWRVDRFPL
jgi:hypothetical protein